MAGKRCALLAGSFEEYPFGLNELESSCAAWKTRVSEHLERLIREEGVTEFLIIPSFGAGLFAAELAAAKREDGIQLECVIPYEEYTTKWHEAFRDRFFDLLSCCDRERRICTKWTETAEKQAEAYLREQTDLLLELRSLL